MQETERVAEADVGGGGDEGAVPDDGAKDYHAVFLFSALPLLPFDYICLVVYKIGRARSDSLISVHF